MGSDLGIKWILYQNDITKNQMLFLNLFMYVSAEEAIFKFF